MQINLQDHIKVVTNYNFKLLRNEVLLQEVNTHNILTNTFWLGRSGYASHVRGIQSCEIALGKGSGTPKTSDTALFQPLWQKAKDSTSSSYHARTSESNEEWIQLTNKYTIPANTTYVGTITECGLYHYSRLLCTHALLLDAEGNPISIEKTDLDVLIIEVTIRLYFTENESIKMIRADHTPFWTHLFSGDDEKACLHYTNNLEVLWSIQDSLDGNEMYLNNFSRGFSPAWNSYLSTAICNGKQDIPITTPRELTFNAARLGTDWPVTGQHFIKGLRIMRSFIISFPNTDIFPAYNITGMDVGIGDGETTEFICPMNYFVKDTDKIYIDGILQTRGVDYIVENDNNNQMLPELMACNDAIITGGYYQIDSYNNNFDAPVFRAVLNASKITGFNDSGFRGAGNKATYATMFDKDRPLFIDMQKEVKVNTFQIGSGYNCSTFHGGVKYTLSYSDDGVNYVELATIIKTTYTVSKVTFDTITKRYFKVTIEYVSDTSNVSSNAYERTIESDIIYSAAVDKNNLCLLGYVGHGIQFTNPPAEGAVITMDATTDLPMKNENFVFDTTLKLSY